MQRGIDVFHFRTLKVVASLLSPTAFALGSINFADYERAHVGLRWTNIWRVCSIIEAYVITLSLTCNFVSKVS